MAQPEQIGQPREIGRYQVRRVLGAGGMGVVYAAYDPNLEREVAVKLLRKDRFEDCSEAASEELRREAKITAKLAHPNVVTIFDVGQYEQSVYLAMEYVDGPSLHRWMNDTVRPWREVLGMFFQAGLGLAAAHQAGLIHRDFKPGNVLIGDRRARVVDFGLAVAGTYQTPGVVDLDALDAGTTADGVGRGLDGGEVERETTRPTSVRGDANRSGASGTDPTILAQTGGSTSPASQDGPSFAGTPGYMAPELFLGGVADARTDQFAFCVALYEALYGERPFAGSTIKRLAENVIAGVLSPAPKRARVPGWLRNIVIRGLAVDPRERHVSIKSLLASVAFTARIMWD